MLVHQIPLDAFEGRMSEQPLAGLRAVIRAR